jgi:hypothetical protein
MKQVCFSPRTFDPQRRRSSLGSGSAQVWRPREPEEFGRQGRQDDALPFPGAFLLPADEAAWGEGQRGRV